MKKLLIIILIITFACSVFSQERVSYTFYGKSYNGKVIFKLRANNKCSCIDVSYKQLIPRNVTHLTMQGEITDNVIYFMRDSLPNLTYLDLSQVFIVPDNPSVSKKSLFRYEVRYPYNFDHKSRIPDNAFRNTKIDSIILPSGVVRIGENAFIGCKNLQYISLPDSLRQIWTAAFFGCESLSVIKIPEKAKVYIHNDAFSRCRSLTEVVNSHNIVDMGDWIDIKNGISGHFGVFGDCTNLRSFTFSNTISAIERRTFIGCKSLQSVIFPDSLKRIDQSAFFNCTALTDIKLPHGLRVINSRAFGNCTGLTTITLPESIERIEEETFVNCTGLKKISVYWQNPESVFVNNSNFGVREQKSTGIWITTFNNKRDCILEVPFGTKEKYLALETWKNFQIIERKQEK